MRTHRHTFWTSLVLLLAFFFERGQSAPAWTQDAKPAVAVVHPVERESREFEFSGRIEAPALLELRSPRAGVISKVDCRPGLEVKRGEALFEYAADSAKEELVRAGKQLKKAEAVLAKLQADLKDARGLLEQLDVKARNAKLDEELGRIQAPIEKSRDLALAALKEGGLFAAREQTQKLYEDLDRALRLIKARAPLSAAYLQDRLAGLRRNVTQLLEGNAGSAKEQPAKKLASSLRELAESLDRVRLLSLARSKEGIATLIAERDLADLHLRLARKNKEDVESETANLNVIASADGRIVEVFVKSGDKVEKAAGSQGVLGTLLSAKTIRIAFEVDSESLQKMGALLRAGKIKLRRTSEVPVTLALPDDKDYTHSGTLEMVDQCFDKGRCRLKAYALFDRSDQALASAADSDSAKEPKTVRVRLDLGQPAKLLLVPRSAVGANADGKRFLLVVNAQNVVDQRPVELGGVRNDYQEIVGGLKADDWVIVGSAREKSKDGQLTPRDFSGDIRSLRIRPGMTVEAARITLPAPDRQGNEKR